MEGRELQSFERFATPQDELEYLRNRVKSLEDEKHIAPEQAPERTTDEHIAHLVTQYKDVPTEEVVADHMQVTPEQQEAIVLDLEPENHDARMEEFAGLLEEKGVKTTLDIITRTADEHLIDDFHRFLVAYIKAGYQPTDVKENTPVYRMLHRTLFEVAIPDNIRSEDSQGMSELVAMMQQLYAGVLNVAGDASKDEYITVEIAKPVGKEDFTFYFSVPDSKVELFERHVHSYFSDIILQPQTNDFNVFVTGGEHVVGHMTQRTTPARMIKTIDDFENDPMKAIINALSKLDVAEGAAIQLVFKPVGGFYEKQYHKGLLKLQNGATDAEEFHVKNTLLGKVYKNALSLARGTHKAIEQKDGEPIKQQSDGGLQEQVTEKLKHPIVSSNIRIIASSQTDARSRALVDDISSSFNQFADPIGNSLVLNITAPAKEREMSRQFSFRQFNAQYDVPCNLAEVAAMFHFPAKTEKKNPLLRVSKAATAPAALNMSQEGILLGENKHAGTAKQIHMTPEDRLRHMYVIGQTGTGKTNYLKSMIIQDIQNGDGVCLIDPHGSDVQDVLANIPQERLDDVIYFDPAYTDRPMGLNMLEYDHNYPEQKTFVVNELFSIFQKLYGANPESMGPMFEQYFRNATMLVIEDPTSGSTLLDVSRVLSDKAFRQLKLSRCKNPVVVEFWTKIAEKAGGEASLENIIPYITSKFDVFLANDIMRPVIAQETSSFNFRKIMDEKKILLVNLSKGRLGDINANLIGLILVGKILMAALSRVDTSSKDLAPFYLYIDEFQNVTTDSIATILSEARKYKLSLNIAHQFIAQLEEPIKDAVFGNVGTMAVFRVGSDDAQYLESQFAPQFSASDIMNIDNYNCYIKMLSGGVPKDPFNMSTYPAPDGKPEIVEDLKAYSYQKYGKNRDEIEQAIMQKYGRTAL